MITDILDTVADTVGGLVSSLSDTIVGDIVHAISVYLGSKILLLVQLIMELVRAAYSLFSVFAGITKVRWDGEYTYLFNIFFQNSSINGIYWGMAMIGFVLLIGFCIVAIIRKIFDLGDHEQRSIGQILGSGFKSLLVIVSLTAILTAGTTLTNLLIQQVSYVFDHGSSLTLENDLEFTDEQYATMARIYNTIGNYSLNPGYAQKYNLNACYNEIRPDLLYLQDQGVFDYFYPDVDEYGDPDPTWQSELQKLILANDPNHALKMDPYYEGVSNALLEIITILQTDAEFYPVSRIQNQYVSVTEVPLDRVLFLSGTMNAAKNELYNAAPGFDDSLRGAFYSGEKSIYNIFDVSEAFDISLGSINYLIILLGAYWVLKNLFRCLLNCTSRIVNIIGLYVIAPPIAAAMPLDGGKKFREWTNSMIIQMIGIFGNIIPMRLVMLFLPIIMSSKLTLVGSTITNIIGKVIIVWGMLEAVGRFNGVLTGILANNGAGGAMRNIESTNRTADTRFSRYGGKYVPGTTDVDDPSGRGKKAERQHEREMAEQRNYQQRQNSGGNAGSGGGGQLAANMAMKAAAAANPAVGAAMAAGKAAGIGGGDPGSGMRGFGGAQTGSGDSQKKDAVLKAGMMAATGGASAGMSAGGPGGMGGGIQGGGFSGDQGGTQESPQQGGDNRGPSKAPADASGADAGIRNTVNNAEAEGNGVGDIPAHPDPQQKESGPETGSYQNKSPEERQRMHDSLFGAGRSDASTGKAFSQPQPEHKGNENVGGPVASGGNRNTGAGRNSMSFEEFQEIVKAAGPARQSQLDSLFGTGELKQNGGAQDRAQASGDHTQTRKSDVPRPIPKRTVPPPRRSGQTSKGTGQDDR